MIAGDLAQDRGDALAQCATFVLVIAIAYWAGWMDHGDDGIPDPPGLAKWWKSSEVRAHNLGHAARIDPGIREAIRLTTAEQPPTERLEVTV